MELPTAQLAAAVGCPVTRAQLLADPLSAAMNRYAITSPKRMAAFLAQIGHESASFSRVEENLNYSAAAFGNWPPQPFPVRTGIV